MRSRGRMNTSHSRRSALARPHGRFLSRGSSGGRMGNRLNCPFSDTPQASMTPHGQVISPRPGRSVRQAYVDVVKRSLAQCLAQHTEAQPLPRPPPRCGRSSAWTSSPVTSPPCRRTSTAGSSSSAPRAPPLPPDMVREGEVLDERALGEALRELFQDGGLGKRVRVGTRQPAHRAAHAGAAAGHRPQGARRRGALPGRGPGADAARGRGAGLPLARRVRHPGWARASA